MIKKIKFIIHQDIRHWWEVLSLDTLKKKPTNGILVFFLLLIGF